ncbi:putative membrane protein [Brucella sp. 10RB9215]|uniref:Uncharacterized protein n=1 Tax=Brucella tritici TaxID=94626 RepID=A0A833CRB8_9HYPH|nr:MULTISPECIES: hypothetical protein [Brucella]KAB2666515.1 hypothetical protein F9K91_04845 [Brucella tritici]SBW15279.1 putative membrane protein [Brucella sp. 10RB9215]
MDLSGAFSKLVEQYGLPGVVIAILLVVCRSLWIAYKAEVDKGAANGVKIALAMERNTQAIESLKEVIRNRS